MNERVMQFRIGMFVIVAGLVLTMLIVWFGESPSLFRDHVYLRVRYDEAPGVAEGIPIRKSGIRVGEVTAIDFDERPNVPDGVLVTLSLERKYKLKAGTIPRVTRSLMGDASIDLLPGHGKGPMQTGDSPLTAPIIEGEISPDPSKALAAATQAFEKVGDTLKSIDKAANGIAEVAKNADKLSTFLATWNTAGQRITAAADGIDRFIRTNEGDVRPAIANFREVAAKFNTTFDPQTQDALKSGVRQFAMASGKLNQGLNDAGPLFKDLGAPVNAKPQTDFGQTVRRLNLIASDLSLLTQALRDPSGHLNTNGSLQRLLSRPDLYENMNRMAVSGAYAFDGLKPILVAFRTFAEKISRDPSALAKGALAR